MTDNHLAFHQQDIVERLRAACNGHPHAKIAWPHYVLHQGADEIEYLREKVQVYKELYADANKRLHEIRNALNA